MRGVFNLRLSTPKSHTIWDVSIVLKYLKALAPNESISIKSLTLKTAMLIALVTCQRRQTLRSISLKDLTVTSNTITIRYNNKLLKQSRPGYFARYNHPVLYGRIALSLSSP